MLRNRLLYIIIFILSLNFIYFYGGKVPYMLFYAVILLPFFSFIYTLAVYLRFGYSQSLSKNSVVKGEKILFRFNLKNRDFILYPYLKVKFYNENRIFAKQLETKNLSLTPASDKLFSYELECKYRGRYMLGIEYIEVEDFLGIFRFRKNVPDRFKITVYPRIIKLDNFYLKHCFFSESLTMAPVRTHDANMVSDIRKFVQGDTYRNIHWKLSAKMNELMVKNLQGSSEIKTVMILDLMKTSDDAEESIIIEDKIIEASVALLHYCVTSNIPVELVFYNNNVNSMVATDMAGFNTLYGFLSDVPFNQNAGLEDMLAVYNDYNSPRTNIVVLTCYLNLSVYNRIKSLKEIGHEPVLIYICKQNTGNDLDRDTLNIINNLKEYSIDVFSIGLEDDIKKVLEKNS